MQTKSHIEAAEDLFQQALALYRGGDEPEAFALAHRAAALLEPASIVGTQEAKPKVTDWSMAAINREAKP
jgi:hypothetical protein